MVLISERPAEVDDRAVPGHWEGDLSSAARDQCQLGVLVERATRFVRAGPPVDGRSAPLVGDAITAEIATLPATLRRSLTWDQGKEMAGRASFTVATGVPVDFCDPPQPLAARLQRDHASVIISARAVRDGGRATDESGCRTRPGHPSASP